MGQHICYNRTNYCFVNCFFLFIRLFGNSKKYNFLVARYVLLIILIMCDWILSRLSILFYFVLVLYCVVFYDHWRFCLAICVFTYEGNSFVFFVVNFNSPLVIIFRDF